MKKIKRLLFSFFRSRCNGMIGEPLLLYCVSLVMIAIVVSCVPSLPCSCSGYNQNYKETS